MQEHYTNRGTNIDNVSNTLDETVIDLPQKKTNIGTYIDDVCNTLDETVIDLPQKKIIILIASSDEIYNQVPIIMERKKCDNMTASTIWLCVRVASMGFIKDAYLLSRLFFGENYIRIEDDIFEAYENRLPPHHTLLFSSLNPKDNNQGN